MVLRALLTYLAPLIPFPIYTASYNDTAHDGIDRGPRLCEGQCFGRVGGRKLHTS